MKKHTYRINDVANGYRILGFSKKYDMILVQAVGTKDVYWVTSEEIGANVAD